jgi:hypothetical protein
MEARERIVVATVDAAKKSRPSFAGTAKSLHSPLHKRAFITKSSLGLAGD